MDSSAYLESNAFVNPFPIAPEEHMALEGQQGPALRTVHHLQPTRA